MVPSHTHAVYCTVFSVESCIMGHGSSPLRMIMPIVRDPVHMCKNSANNASVRQCALDNDMDMGMRMGRWALGMEQVPESVLGQSTHSIHGTMHIVCRQQDCLSEDQRLSGTALVKREGVLSVQKPPALICSAVNSPAFLTSAAPKPASFSFSGVSTPALNSSFAEAPPSRSSRDENPH